MDDKFMAGMYSAFDVLLNPSMSEGFGVPIIEAQSCGVPVIVSNCTSMPELCGAGWLVEGDNWWNDPIQAWAFMPFIHSIAEQLENAYVMRGDEKLKGQARRFAQTYDADRITELYWKPTLEALESGPKKKAPMVRVGRKERRAHERAQRKMKGKTVIDASLAAVVQEYEDEIAALEADIEAAKS